MNAAPALLLKPQKISSDFTSFRQSGDGQREAAIFYKVMIKTFREFEPAPDPFGRKWRVHFRWLQTATSIRHADTVDVKFGVSVDGAPFEERVVALSHPVLLDLSHASGTPLTDGWCLKLAAIHLEHMIETGEDIEKTLVTPSADELHGYAAALKKQAGDRTAALI